jgi:hypothetical protein
LPKEVVTYVVDFSAILPKSIPSRFKKATLRRAHGEISRMRTDQTKIVNGFKELCMASLYLARKLVELVDNDKTTV